MGERPRKQNAAEVERLIDEIISEYREAPVDLLGRGEAEGEHRYLVKQRASYVRTVRDLLAPGRGPGGGPVNILEIGSFLGVVSVALARLGYRVTALDIPEFMSCERLTGELDAEGVAHVACNLRSRRLPFGDGKFDLVVMCEVLEHLNFNPLPLVKEINRVTRTGGLLYVTLPNLARSANCLRLASGESINNPVEDFFRQLDRDTNMIVGLHWREYTAPEIGEMLEAMGFDVVRQGYDPGRHRRGLKRLLKRLIGCVLNIRPVRRVVLACLFEPARDRTLGPYHVTLARKRERCGREFHFTDATLPDR